VDGPVVAAALEAQEVQVVQVVQVVAAVAAVAVVALAAVGPVVPAAAPVAAIRKRGGNRCLILRTPRSGPSGPSFATPWISAGSNSASGTAVGVARAAGGDAEAVSETLGLLEEAMQLARDLGFRVREEPLGDLPGGACAVGGKRQILLNAAHPSSQRLDTLLEILAGDPGVADQPVSHLLESRLRRHSSDR